MSNTKQYNSKDNMENIKNSIIINANKMIDLNGKIDTFKLIDKSLIDNNPITKLEDEEGNILNAGKDNNYWLNEIDNYIKYLEDKLKQDLSNINSEELEQLSVEFNKKFLNKYIGGFSIYAIDLIDKKSSYANHLATALVDLQTMQISNIGIDNFINLDLTKSDANFKQLMQLETLQAIQKQIKNISSKSKNSIDINLIKPILYQEQIIDSLKQVEKIIKDNKEYYLNLHKKYETIDKLTEELKVKYQAKDKELNNKSELTIITSKSSDIDDDIVKREFVKLPKNYTIDFDIMKLFNNIYPNYKYKSIDDNRHKNIDIKAKLVLDIDVNTEDVVNNMLNMRLIEFIKSGNIALYPIQSALINGFIDIRDNQDTMDKVIPLLSTLKHITENKKLRLPKSKKDLELYENFMLFFDRCKMQIKIVDRASKKVVFEIAKPISILSNTPAYNGHYGYIIGNSVLNILKNELDKINDIPHRTSIKDSKGYLLSKLPNTPPTINLTQHIYSKIAVMINSYHRLGKYKGVINIEPLYDFQAFYNKHPRPTKDDMDKVRDMLNAYLDSLITKGLIVSYKADKTKKVITQYKVEINKDARL